MGCAGDGEEYEHDKKDEEARERTGMKPRNEAQRATDLVYGGLGGTIEHIVLTARSVMCPHR